MNTVLEGILTDGYVTSADGSIFDVFAQVDRSHGELLQEVIHLVRPAQLLEIGLACGISSLFICDALREIGGVKHTIIDPFQFDDTLKGVGLHNLEKAGYHNLIEFHEDKSHNVLPRFHAEGRRFDFAFIDGSHLFDYVFVDFYYVDLLLRPGGAIVFHDALSYPAVRKVCRYMLTNRAYRVLRPSVEAIRHESLTRRLAMSAPGISHFIKEKFKPEVIESDSRLGLPFYDCIAFEKIRDDLTGECSNESRRWDFHREF